MNIYHVKTQGNEDNGYNSIDCGYDYSQYKEVVQMLKENNTPYKVWIERI